MLLAFLGGSSQGCNWATAGYWLLDRMELFLRSIQLAFTGCLSLLPTGATGSASSAFLQAWRYRCSISQVASIRTGSYSRAGQAQRSLEGSASLWIQGRDRCLSQGCQRRNHTSSQSLCCLDTILRATPSPTRTESAYSFACCNLSTVFQRICKMLGMP